jgi:hypothetical protein
MTKKVGRGKKKNQGTNKTRKKLTHQTRGGAWEKGSMTGMMAPTKSGPSLASECVSTAGLHTVRHVSLFVTDWPLDKTGGSQK